MKLNKIIKNFKYIKNYTYNELKFLKKIRD